MFGATSRGAIRARFTMLIAVVVGSAVSGRPVLADDATAYRGGPGLTGFYSESFTTPLSLVWKFTAQPTPRNSAAVVVVGKSVFYSAGSRIYCIDTDTGAQKWRFPADQPLATVIHATPTYDSGHLYVAAADGKMYSLDAEAGRLEWAFDTRSSLEASPTVVNNVIYFGSSDGKIWAVDTRSHEALGSWKTGLRAGDELTGAPAVANSMVYALTLDGFIRAIGTATGSERYYQRVPGTVLKRAPIVAGEFVIIASGGNITCFMARNLQQRWFISMPTEISATPAVSDQGIFVVTTDGFVYCLDVRSGRTKWRSTKAIDFDVSTPPTVCGNSLIVGCSQGAIFVYDAAKGNLKWTYKVDPSTSNTESIPSYSNIAAPIVAANQTLYVVSDDGTLSAMRSDGNDTVGPIFTDVEPEPGLVINGEPPFHFEAKITDEGSGVNPESVRVLMDGEGVVRRPDGREGDDKNGYRYDVHNSLLEFDIFTPGSAAAIRPLSNGKHIVTITSADWRGNVSSRSISFMVDNSITRKMARKKRSDTNQGGLGGVGGPGGGAGKGGGGAGGGRG